ncbi:extracellular solute-binding protein [Patescibacteria group bacterium]|nr:extracellular solute-binding protein [Patescibacteria group bacterium]
MPDIPLPQPQMPVAPKAITPPPNIPSVSSGTAGLPKPPAFNVPVPSKPETPKVELPKPVAPAPSVPNSVVPTPVAGNLPKPIAPAAPTTLPAPPKPPMATPSGMPPAPTAVKPENPSTQPAGATPQMASTGNPLKKFLPIIIAVILLLVVGVGAFAFMNGQNKPTSVKTTTTNTPTNTTKTSASPTSDSGRQTVPDKKIQITYWGLWELSATMEQIFSDFEKANPGVEVIYQVQSHVDYRQRLQTAIASGNGPDLFRYHASWVPMLSAELASLPSKIMSVNEFQQTFYPVAVQQLQYGGQIVGVPLMYDGLGLYYNTEVLSTAGVEPPKTWVELKSLASRLTIRNGNEIKRAGLAIGNASTTEHFADIIGLLMLQNGADPKNLTSKEAQDAMVFYTNFVSKDKVWDEKLPTSTVAFARGDAAMMLAPSWRAHEVMALNPNLKFGITTVPTLGEQKISWATYWAEGVSNKSKNQEMAWQLIKYMSSKEVMQKMYAEQAKTRAFGEIYSRIDLADSLASDPYVAPFLADAPYAKGWYLSSYTHDNGLNDNLIKYYQDAVNALVLGKNLETTMETLSLGSQQVLRQYKIK